MKLKKEYRKKLNARVETIDRGVRARTQDIYALMSYSDLLYLIGPRILPPLLLLILPLLVGGTYWLNILSLACFYAIASMSWDVLSGYTGLVSFGHALFIGFGGYTAAILNIWYHVPIWFSIPLGAVLGAVTGTLFFIPCLRIKGAYFSMASLVVPLVMVNIIFIFSKSLGGEQGIYGLGNPLPDVYWYYLMTVLVLVTYLFLRKFVYSDYGIILQAIRDNEQSVRASGINVFKYKSLALFVSGFFASLAGALQAHELAFVGPSFFYMTISVSIIAMGVLGSIATIAGPAIGAFILTLLTEVLRPIGAYRMLFYSIILILLLIVKPEGLYRYLERKYHTIERRVVER